jgi:hypothetical protein
MLSGRQFSLAHHETTKDITSDSPEFYRRRETFNFEGAVSQDPHSCQFSLAHHEATKDITTDSPWILPERVTFDFNGTVSRGFDPQL